MSRSGTSSQLTARGTRGRQAVVAGRLMAAFTVSEHPGSAGMPARPEGTDTLVAFPHPGADS
ncbi:MAG: hypothetical protein OXG81_01750 [Acidobacteria bacterium]|nr:hypothetical protein [Acidobacteriota bacterium]